MPLTLFDKANGPLIGNKLDRQIAKSSDSSFKEIISQKFDDAYKPSESKIKDTSKDNILKFMHEQVTTGYSDHAAHVSGYYYIQMIHGTWADHAASLYTTSTTSATSTSSTTSTTDNVNYDKDYINDNDTSKFTSDSFKLISNKFGQLATDIDIPQLNIEYESISGKSRNLSYASRLHYAGDFSINFIETYTNHVFRYHEAWFKYIDALKKGYVTLDIKKAKDTDYVIDVPYFNAVWVVIFAPFTTNIRGLVKIMGVSPINLPIKQVIGDRGKTSLTTLNQNYKSNDMVYKFFDSSADRDDSLLYKEFISDMQNVYK